MKNKSTEELKKEWGILAKKCIGNYNKERTEKMRAIQDELQSRPEYMKKVKRAVI